MRGTRLAARFWGIAKRKGRPKALVATAHTILIVAYHILKDRRPYEEHGEDYLAKRKQQKSTSVMINELTKLGYEITKGKEVS
jgi:putative exporter of polyketide antibiotics